MTGAAVLAILTAGTAALAQTGELPSLAALPEAPEAQVATRNVPGPTASTASVGGTVLDPNGNPVQSAHVQLDLADGTTAVRRTDTNSTGGFEFTGIAPGTYRVTVTGNGLTKYVSQPVAAQADQPVSLPNIVMSLEGSTTTVTVMDPEAASIEQERIAVQQRVFGVFTNFYSSFDWNAPPMLPKQKYTLATRTVIDPITFLITGGVAAVEQWRNVFPSFGGGWSGYGKRYGTAYANHVASEMFTRAIYPSIFHQDPRYFVMEKGSTRQRALHAMGSTFVTRSDRGGHRFNYSEVLGDLSAAALAEAYYPPRERGPSVFVVNGFGAIGGNMVDNLFREFLFNNLTRRAKGQGKP